MRRLLKLDKGKAEKALEKLVYEICNNAYVTKCMTDLFRLLHFKNRKISSHLTVLLSLLGDYNTHLSLFQDGSTEVAEG